MRYCCAFPSASAFGLLSKKRGAGAGKENSELAARVTSLDACIALSGRFGAEIEGTGTREKGKGRKGVDEGPIFHCRFAEGGGGGLNQWGHSEMV